MPSERMLNTLKAFKVVKEAIQEVDNQLPEFIGREVHQYFRMCLDLGSFLEQPDQCEALAHRIKAVFSSSHFQDWVQDHLKSGILELLENRLRSIDKVALTGVPEVSRTGDDLHLKHLQKGSDRTGTRKKKELED